MDYEPGILLGAGDRTVNKTSHTCSHDSQSGGKTDAKHTLNSVWTSVVTLSAAPGVSPCIAMPEVRCFPVHPNIIKLGVKRLALFLWLYLASNIFRPSSPPQVNPRSSRSHHTLFSGCLPIQCCRWQVTSAKHLLNLVLSHRGSLLKPLPLHLLSLT